MFMLQVMQLFWWSISFWHQLYIFEYNMDFFILTAASMIYTLILCSKEVHENQTLALLKHDHREKQVYYPCSTQAPLLESSALINFPKLGSIKVHVIRLDQMTSEVPFVCSSVWFVDCCCSSRVTSSGGCSRLPPTIKCNVIKRFLPASVIETMLCRLIDRHGSRLHANHTVFEGIFCRKQVKSEDQHFIALSWHLCLSQSILRAFCHIDAQRSKYGKQSLYTFPKLGSIKVHVIRLDQMTSEVPFVCSSVWFADCCCSSRVTSSGGCSRLPPTIKCNVIITRFLSDSAIETMLLNCRWLNRAGVECMLMISYSFRRHFVKISW